MTKTISDVIDSLYRGWLEPPTAQPIRAFLDGPITDDDTSLTYVSDYLSPEESYLLAPGSMVEIGQELILVGGLNTSTNSIFDLKRGMQGTEATDHEDGAAITIQPRYPRSVVFSAVQSAVAGLWPPLYEAAVASNVSVANTPTPAPTDIVQPISFIYKHNGTWHSGPTHLLNPYPDSPTGRALAFPDVPLGSNGILSYRKPPRIPRNEDEFLSDLGIDHTWERIIHVDCVLNLINVFDIDHLFPNLVATKVDPELTPVGLASQLRETLHAYYEELVSRAKRKLDAEFLDPIQVSRGSHV